MYGIQHTTITSKFFGESYLLIEGLLIKILQDNVSLPSGSIFLQTVPSDWKVLEERFKVYVMNTKGQHHYSKDPKFDTVMIGKQYSAAVYGCWIESMSIQDNFATAMYDFMEFHQTKAEHLQMLHEQRGRLLGGDLGII